MPALFETESFPAIHYQAESLRPLAAAGRIRFGFTGKPLSLGGPPEKGSNGQENPLEVIQANRERLHQAIQESIPQNSPSLSPWAIPQQTHEDGIGVTGDADFHGKDAIILAHTYHPAMVLSADCVPIILYSPDCHVGAVIHAGWRSTAAEIARKTVQKLEADFNCPPASLHAVIGPAITKAAFQVSRDVLEALAPSVGLTVEEYLAQFYADEDEHDLGKFWVNVKRTNGEQLRQAGIPLSHIETLPHCTVQANARLFSHRMGDNGRNASYLVLL
jgi:polyphenol oxidase